jgi:hypothetical protein
MQPILDIAREQVGRAWSERFEGEGLGDLLDAVCGIETHQAGLWHSVAILPIGEDIERSMYEPAMGL